MAAKPLPSNIKRLRGTEKPCRANPNEPTYPELNERPTGLSDEAARHWERIVPMLNEAGILVTVDEIALRLYCETYVTWVAAAKLVSEQGPTWVNVDTKGNEKTVVNPNLVAMNQCFQSLKILLSEFGMTPSSRTKIIGNGKKPDVGDFDNF